MNSQTLPAPSVDAVPSEPKLCAEIRRYGRFDPNGCYQCGTCSLSCDVGGSAAAFPRRVIRYALLGLEKPLAGSLEPWLCRDCGECSTVCPREAEPRSSMEALRRWLIGRYDWTGLAARIQGSRAWHLGSLAVAALVVLGLIVYYHLVLADMDFRDFTDTSMGFEHMFPIIVWFTLAVTLVPLALVATHALRMARLAMAGTRVPLRHYLVQAKVYVIEAVTQRNMRACSDHRLWPRHWVLAFGTVVMLVIKVFFLAWFQTDSVYPVYHPQRWIGYLAFAMLLVGTLDVLTSHFRRADPRHRQWQLADPIFPTLLLLTALTGIVTHLCRYAGLELAAHYSYAVHVSVAAPMLVIEIPFGKWSHMIYRPMALYLQAVKDSAAAAEAAPAGEAAAQHA